jgi:hypothetical protein
MSETNKKSDSSNYPVGFVSSSSSEDSCKTMMNDVMAHLRDLRIQSLMFPDLEPGQKLPFHEVSFPAFCSCCFFNFSQFTKHHFFSI